MKEHPILFNAPMVRAILNGSKTQTRRIWKMPGWAEYDPIDNGESRGLLISKNPKHKGWYSLDEVKSPFGRESDTLWVRETWQGPMFKGELPDDWPNTKYETPEYCAYKANGDSCEYVDMNDDVVQRWKPSIHMPRWASRITLKITNVRVERLNDISKDDVIAEGCYPGTERPANTQSARNIYRELWESINGAGSWETNPWVWVIEFNHDS